MIVGLTFTKIASERTQNANGSINVNYNPSVEDVEEADVSALDEDVTRISFNFPIHYEKDGADVGSITLNGNVLWKGDDAADILDSWEEDEALPENMQLAVLNHLYQQCLPEAVNLANRLELPSPVPMPRAQRQG
jgi:hypothetical protein